MNLRPRSSLPRTGHAKVANTSFNGGGEVHPGWTEDLHRAPPSLRNEPVSLVVRDAENRVATRQDAAPGAVGRWARSVITGLDPRNWTMASAVTGSGVAMGVGAAASPYLMREAVKRHDAMLKENPDLRWNIDKPMPPAWGADMEKLLDAAKDPTLTGDSVGIMGDKAIATRQREKKMPSGSTLYANTAPLGHIDDINKKILAETEALKSPGGLPGGRTARRIFTDGTLPAAAHELGHATGWQGLRAPGTIAGKLQEVATRKNYQVGRAFGMAGTGWLAGKVLKRDDLDEKEKAKALGGLAGLNAAIGLPGVAQLAEETRATLRGDSMLKEMPTVRAAYRRLSVPTYGTYVASHAPGIIGTAVLGGLAAHQAKKHWDKGR